MKYVPGMGILPCAVFCCVLLLTACKQVPERQLQNDFGRYYEEYRVQGSLVLYDQKRDKYILYNEAQLEQPFLPASTFKICNALIGLETGVIPDENFTLPWDSVARNPVWDQDHSLETAFRNSAVWYYQELARRVGPERMKKWLDLATYGNRDTTGGIDLFWLAGGLRISPAQQIDFLWRLRGEELPFSNRSMDIVKRIMIQRDTSGYILRGKTGWGGQDDQDIGWFVGYVETDDNVIYFANCVQTLSKNNDVPERAILFDRSRRAIVDSVLVGLGVVR